MDAYLAFLKRVKNMYKITHMCWKKILVGERNNVKASLYFEKKTELLWDLLI